MLAIARALMSRPKLLLLDEPSMGLSPIMTAEISKIIKQINALDVSIIPGGAKRDAGTHARRVRLRAGNRQPRDAGRRTGAAARRRSEESLSGDLRRQSAQALDCTRPHSRTALGLVILLAEPTLDAHELTTVSYNPRRFSLFL